MKLTILADESGTLEEVASPSLDRLDRSYETAHHVFRFSADSLAEQEIGTIVDEQERCYSDLVSLFGFSMSAKIEYLLTDSPEENDLVLSELFGTSSGPMNGFCIGPNYVFAAYTEGVKCIGHHEVAHLFSYQLCMPKSQFLSEGLAMYMDGSFWGKSNDQWVREYIEKNAYVSVQQLVSDEVFYSFPTELTYPISGAFVAFLVERLGADRFLNEVYASDVPLFENLAALFRCSPGQIEEQFKNDCAR